MNKDRLIRLLIPLCILSLAAMILTLCRCGQSREFTAPPFEPEALAGVPAVEEISGYQELDVGLFRVGVSGQLRLKDGSAEVWFANPQDNSVWLKLRIMDEQGQILGQTGLLRPGEYVERTALEEISPGTAVIMKVMAYEPDTYHSAGALVFHTVVTAE